MITVKLGTHELVMYTNSKDMPHHRYVDFLKYIMMDAGIGSSIEDVMDHLKKLYEYAASKNQDEVMKEAENLHYNFNAILNGVNFQSLSFACRVVSIDGKVCDDISDDQLKETAIKLGSLGVTQKQMEEFVDELKKKITDEMRVYYPEFFPDDEAMSFFQKLKQKILISAALIEENLNPTVTEQLINSMNAQLQALNDFFFDLGKPKNFRFSDPDNEIVRFERTSATLYSMMESNGIQGVKTLSVFEFYSRLDYLKKSAGNYKIKET